MVLGILCKINRYSWMRDECYKFKMCMWAPYFFEHKICCLSTHINQLEQSSKTHSKQNISYTQDHICIHAQSQTGSFSMCHEPSRIEEREERNGPNVSGCGPSISGPIHDSPSIIRTNEPSPIVALLELSHPVPTEFSFPTSPPHRPTRRRIGVPLASTLARARELPSGPVGQIPSGAASPRDYSGLMLSFPRPAYAICASVVRHHPFRIRCAVRRPFWFCFSG